LGFLEIKKDRLWGAEIASILASPRLRVPFIFLFLHNSAVAPQFAMSQFKVQSEDEVYEEKQEIQQVESINRNDNFTQQAQDETLAEAKSSWKVLLANPRALLIILAVQVGQHASAMGA
jgi:hypothetical protein